MFRGVCSLWAVVGLCCLTGCGSTGGGGGGVLNQPGTLPDEDGDGFSEIAPPEGVDFDQSNSLAVRVTNTITCGQAEAAAGVQLPDIVDSIVSLTTRVSVTVTYPGGVTQLLSGAFPVGPLDLAFEIACPESVEVRASVVASVPIMGDQVVSSFGPFSFAHNAGDYPYECGAVVTVTTFTDTETGELTAAVTVE